MAIQTVTPREPKPPVLAPGKVDAGFLAADPHMLRLRELAERVAPTAAPVLIVGDSGTGKEVLARFIHRASDRHGYPFVKLNCAAMPHELLEAELFGHEGTNDGAQRRAGKLELARHGTLLLDEIGEMSPALQARLLQVLEDGTFRRVGGFDAVQSSARIVATSSKPLDAAAEEGSFRKDLFHRLKAIRFTLPALRERRADIPLLAEHFLHGTRTGLTHLPERLARAFEAYPWPGNVRELEHLVQRFTILPDVDMVLEELAAAESESASEAFRESLAPSLERETLAPGKVSLKPLAARAAEEAEKKIVLAVLEETHWNRRRAAARLDICYKTLLNKLHHWELSSSAPRRTNRVARARTEATGASALGDSASSARAGARALSLIPQVATAPAK